MRKNGIRQANGSRRIPFIGPSFTKNFESGS